MAALCPAVMADSTTDGHYMVYVRGAWSGQGDATVSGGTVTITATVRSGSGQTGSLVISSLPIDGSNHFNGTGTIIGVAIKVDGRVQPPDPTVAAGTNSVTTNAVLSATLLGGGSAARVAGGRDAVGP